MCQTSCTDSWLQRVWKWAQENVNFPGRTTGQHFAHPCLILPSPCGDVLSSYTNSEWCSFADAFFFAGLHLIRYKDTVDGAELQLRALCFLSCISRVCVYSYGMYLWLLFGWSVLTSSYRQHAFQRVRRCVWLTAPKPASFLSSLKMVLSSHGGSTFPGRLSPSI